MPSTLKRPSLARLLASLRSAPSRGGTSFPVRTGFPTSLADLVVKNHGRLRKPRQPTPPLSPCPVVTVDELPLTPPPQPLSPVAVRRLDSSPRPEKGGAAIFRLRPELLALGGAVALGLLAVWSEGTVAAFTVAALSLLWIESASRRSQRPPFKEAVTDSCSRGLVSPIREEEEAPPRTSSCSDSDRGSEAPSPPTAGRLDHFTSAGGSGGDDRTSPKQKAKRSLKKLISKKMQKKPKSKDSSDSSSSFDEQPDAAAGDADRPPKTESSVPFSTEQTPSESSIEWSESAVEVRRPGVKFPLGAWALAPVIVAGLDRRREAPGDGAGRALHSVLQCRPATVASDGQE